VVNANAVCCDVNFFGNVGCCANAQSQLNAPTFKSNSVNAGQQAIANMGQLGGKVCGCFADECSEKKLGLRGGL
jgi:hypothetical protein